MSKKNIFKFIICSTRFTVSEMAVQFFHSIYLARLDLLIVVHTDDVNISLIQPSQVPKSKIMFTVSACSYNMIR